MPRHSEGWLKTINGRLYGYYVEYVLNPKTGQMEKQEKSLPLGPKSKIKMWEARVKLRRHIAEQTGPGSREENVTFGWFLEKRFIPAKEGHWREESTKATNLWLLDNHLKKAFGDTLLRDLNKFELQVWLNKQAKQYSDGVVKHCRHFLKAILEEAVDQEFITKNPARKLELPKNRREVDKTVLEWSDIWRVLSRLSGSEMDWLLFQVSMVDGLRPGEIIALRWSSLQPGRLLIKQTVYRGHLRDYGKTKKSATGVPIPQGLYKALLSWQGRCPDPSPDALIFPSSNGTYLNTSNYLNRVLYPIKRDLGLKKLNFQILRRSFTTRGQEFGSLKDLQGVLRHEKIDTTANEYAQVVDARVQELVERMYERLTMGGVKQAGGKLQ